MTFLSFINFYLIPGIVLGCVVALGALGLTLLFGILRFAHFAHGDVMTFGAYAALVAVAQLGISPYAALPAAMAAAIALVLLVDRLFYRPLRRSSPVVLLISGFGVALMLRAVIYMVFGPDSLAYEPGIRRPVLLAGLRIQERHIAIVALTVALALATQLFLARTRTGKAMRAMADNPDLARVCGIAVERVIAWTWVIGGALAAAAGVFLAVDTQLMPLMGANLLLSMFAAVILGGIGRPLGAIVGGLIIGVAEELAAAPLIGDAGLVQPAYKVGVAFAAMVLMLILRPTGLFRGQA
jgi:branched-subunit amino acid ABC-type transport system permease component